MAHITGTQAAFATMIQKPDATQKLGVSTSQVAAYKRYVRTGQSISLKKMEALLATYGATVVQEKVWDV